MYKDMITKEIMQECIDQGMTQTEMAVRLDTSFETIHRLLKQYDLKPAYASITCISLTRNMQE